MATAIDGPKLAAIDYKVVRTLGTGAGSTILLVIDQKSGRRFALKVVRRQTDDDDVYVGQAQHEFEIAGLLRHPSILQIYDCRLKRKLFRTVGVELLMEFVDGRVLDELREPELPQLVLIFSRVASALGHMHGRGVAHGDLKPGNVMLSKGGEVKVLDFGTAWLKGQDKARVQGTPQYMAPEQARDRLVDERTDLYNFGATMYRLVTGRYANLALPIGALNGLAAKLEKVAPPSQIVPTLPARLSDTIMACLRSSRDRRPTDMGEVKGQLDAVARSLGVAADDLRGSEEA